MAKVAKKSTTIFLASHNAQGTTRIVSFDSADDRSLFLSRLPKDVQSAELTPSDAARILLYAADSTHPQQTVAAGCWLSHAHYPGPLSGPMRA